MADITTNLGTKIDSVKRPIASEPETTSGLEVLAKAGSMAVKAIDSFTEGQRSYDTFQMRKEAQARQAQKDKATSTGTTLAELSMSSPGSTSFDSTDPLSKLGLGLASAREALSQGTLSLTAYNARVFTLEQTIRSQYGDEVFNEYRDQLHRNKGDKSVLFGALSETDKLESEFKDLIQARSEAYKVAVNAGIDESTFPGGRAGMIEFGQKQMAADRALELAQKKLNFAVAQADLGEKERARLKAEGEDQATQAFFDSAANNLDATLNVVFSSIPAGLGDDATKAFLLEKVPLMEAGWESWKLSARRQLEKTGMSSTKIDGILKSRDDAFVKMMTNIREAPEVMTKQLQIIQNRVGLSAAAAMPLLTTVTSLFGKPGATAFLERMNPDVLKGLVDEANSKMGSLDQAGSKFAHFSRMSMVLNGQIDRNRLTPEQSKAVLVDTVKLVPTLTNLIANDKGVVDPVTLQATKGGLSEVAMAATRANPATGLSDLKALLPALVGNDIIRTLKSGVDSGDGSWKEVAITNKVGTAQALQMILAGSEGKYLKYNRATGRFESTYKVPSTNGVGLANLAGKLDKFTGVPQNVAERVKLANQALDHLAAFDSVLPEQKIGSSLQERTFFATGEVPESMKKTNADGKPNASVEKAVKDLLTTFQRGPEALAADVTNTQNNRDIKLTIDRNNNPGALEDGDFAKSQPGYISGGGRYARFASPQDGIKAQETLLSTRYLSKGVNTVDKIIDKYTPAAPENPEANRLNYKNYVAKKLGVSLNDTLTEEQVSALAKAMREFETGRRA